MRHCQYKVDICNHDSIINGRGEIVLPLASPSYYNGHRGGEVVLALASTSYYKVGTRTRVKATPTNLLHIHNTTNSSISGKSSVVDTKENVKRSKRKRETVSRVGGENQLRNDVVTKGIRKKNIRQCYEAENGLARVSPYFWNVDTQCAGNLIMRNENKSGNTVPEGDFLVNNKKRRKNNVQDDRLPHEHENRNALTSDGFQEESDVGISTVSTITKEKKRKNPSATACRCIVSLKGESYPMRSMKEGCLHESQGCSQVSTIRKVSPYFTQEKDYAFVISSIFCEHQSGADHGVYTAEIDVEYGNDKTNIKDECVSNGKTQKAHPCSRNLKRKKVKYATLLPLKNEKNHDLTSDVGQEDCGKVIHKMRRKTKKNKDKEVSLTKCCQLKGQECELDQEDSDKMIHKISRKMKKNKDKEISLTICSQLKGQEREFDQEDCDKMIHKRSRKTKKKNKDKAASLTKHSQLMGQEHEHDNTCETLDCLQGFTVKKVSPYFRPKLQSEEPDDKINNSDVEFHTNRPCRNTAINVEEVLSKYTYKSEPMVSRDQTNGSAGKKKKPAARSTGLSAAEKLAEPYRRKDPCNTWKPPRSPHNLLQEDHVHDPWRILVICMLLNITTGPQVRQVLSALFSLCPNAEAAVSVDVLEIQRVIQSLGLQRKRAAMIKSFSREYLSDHWTHVTQLPGIGKYAADAYAIFCNGMWRQVTPNDHMLVYYWKFLKNRGLKPV